MTTSIPPWQRARRAFSLLFGVGVAVTMASMFYSAAQLRVAEGFKSVNVAIGGVTMFHAERAPLETGSTVSLRAGIGVVIALVVIPALVAGLVWLKARSNSGRKVLQSA